MGGGILRGIEDLYNSSTPFADKFAPTLVEIDHRNIKVINHIRSMLGNTTKVTGNPRLYLEVAWADERKFGTIWDAKYPRGLNSAYSPCSKPTSKGHCGATFFPDVGDRAPYALAALYFGDFCEIPGTCEPFQ
jgi:hypothetical protein